MPEKPVTTIWINARFLGRTLTGVERVAYELLDALCRLHLDADGCCLANGMRYRFRLIAPSSMARASSPWNNLPLVHAGLFSGHLWEQFDLPRLTRGQLLLSLCNTGPLFKRRHIIYMHDAQPFAIPGNFSLPFRFWYRILMRVTGRCACRVLVNSKFTMSELERHIGLKPSRMQLVYPAAKPWPDMRHTLANLSLPDQPFVLAVSSANPNKNFRGVLDALSLLGDEAPPCVFVGSKDQRHFGAVDIDWDKVTHLGYVTDAELQALYRRAMCLVFPSFYEGFGLPPLEAMAAGCPVIVANTSSMPEVADSAALYCDPNDSRTLADAIARLRASDSLRESLLEDGLQRAASFSWSRSATILLDTLLQDIAATSASHVSLSRACSVGKSR